MADEILTLDHGDVAVGRTALVIHSPGNGIRVKGEEGPAYDDAVIAAYLSEQRWGAVPVDQRIENRKVTLPLVIDNRTGTFAGNRRDLQEKVGLLQREGGYLTRTMKDGSKIHLDVVDASLKLASSTFASLEQYDDDSELVLTCLPDWYGPEYTLPDRAFTSSQQAASVETGIKGDYPARARIVFDNDGTEDVRGLFMGVRSKNADWLPYLDEFTFDSTGDYIQDSGTGTIDWTGSGTQRTQPTGTTNKRYILNRDYPDMEATIKFLTGATITNTRIGVVLKRLDANNYLIVRAGGGVVEIYTVINGVLTSKAAAAAVLSTATNYWVRGRIDGNVVQAEIWTAAPTAHGSPASGTTHTLSGGDAVMFGEGVPGKAGLYWSPHATDERMDDLFIQNPRSALFYDANSLTALDTASTQASTGGNEGQIIRHANLMTSFTPVLKTTSRHTAAAEMTHRGTYRVWVRVWTPHSDPNTGAGSVTLKFVWSVGDLNNAIENPEVTVPAANEYYLLDLGTIRLDPAPVGQHSWRGELQAKALTNGDDINVDMLYFVPSDEMYLEARAPLKSLGLNGTIVSRDSFSSLGVGSNLNGRTADVGGTWTTSAAGGGGSTTDFQGADSVFLTPSSRVIQRATISDGTSGGGSGRLAISSTTFGEIMVQGNFMVGLYGGGDPVNVNPALVARYVDSSNFLQLRMFWFGKTFVYLRLRVAGVDTVLALKEISFLNGVWTTIRMTCYANGTVVAQILWGAYVLWTLQGYNAALATGGALDDGKFGIEDYNGSTVPWVRQYDSVFAMAPPKDAVAFAGRQVQFGYDGAFRNGASGGPYQPIAPRGDNFRLPPSVLEGRPVEVLARPSVSELEDLPDYTVQAKSYQIKYRPCWLFTPEA